MILLLATILLVLGLWVLALECSDRVRRTAREFQRDLARRRTARIARRDAWNAFKDHASKTQQLVEVRVRIGGETVTVLEHLGGPLSQPLAITTPVMPGRVTRGIIRLLPSRQGREALIEAADHLRSAIQDGRQEKTVRRELLVALIRTAPGAWRREIRRFREKLR
jgi:hypothetical protein